MAKRSRNKVPNKVPGDTQNDGTLCSVISSISRFGKLPDIPKRTLRRYCQTLKSLCIIKKSGYGVWEIADEKKAIEFSRNKVPRPGPSTRSLVAFTDKRGHKFIATLLVSTLDLRKVKQHFDWKRRGLVQWVVGGGAGRYLQCWFGGANFSIYENKVVCRLSKSFYSDHHITTEDMAQSHFKAILRTFSDNMPSTFKVLRLSRSGEFEKIGSDFAKWCDCGLEFREGAFWYKQDRSGGSDNEEGNDAEIMDLLDTSPETTPEGMRHIIKHKKDTGRDWHTDIEDYLTTQAKLMVDKLKLDIVQQQSLNIPKSTAEKKAENRDLSYFG